MMKNNILKSIALALFLLACLPAMAQFNLNKALSAGAKAAQAMTLTDAQMASYVKDAVNSMDTTNTVAADDSPYSIRLKKLTEGLTDVDGVPLNFKVYEVEDVNAFACADGSVRVFSALMDIMNDDELLGIIGHEIGHVALHHSKNAFKTSLMNDALKDGIASTGSKGAALTQSQLVALGNSLVNAKYSQKQEKEADDYGYEFLKAHGKNPWGMVQSFEKLQGMEGESGTKASYIQKMFSSHPDTAERIKRMTKRCKSDGIKRPAAE